MTPSWLTDLLAALMLGVSAYCAGRLVYARLRHRATEYDIDGVHLVMGVAMAGMLVPRLNPLSNRAWEVLFAAAVVWFAVRVVLIMRGRAASLAAIEHCFPHLIAAGAMLYMYLAPTSGMSGSDAGMAGMSGMAAMAGGVRYPTLGLVLAVFLIGYCVLIADRTTTVSTDPPATAESSGRSVGKAGAAAAIPVGGTAHDLLAPRALNGYLIVMSITMAYMLIIML